MPTIESFYLGTMSDLDPDESNFYSENASNMVGLTFGSSGAPLYDSIDALTLIDSDGDGVIYEDDYYDDPGTVSYAGTISALDSIMQVNVTVTYSDGTTATTAMGVLQDVSGRVFLVPNREGYVENDVLDDHPIVSIQIDSIAEADYDGMYSNVEQDAFITCFAAGTLIATKHGLMNIAKLSVGDKVCTLDHGYQPIRWIGERRVKALGKFAPIKISTGALGQGMPTHDLWVSPQHRILVRSKIAQRIFGMSEVLLPAKKMLGLPGITVGPEGGHVTYWHFLFDQHEIVFSEGAATESFYPGPEAMNGLEAHTRAEILTLFPELAQLGGQPEPARPIARGKLQKKLIARHQKNCRLLFQE